MGFMSSFRYNVGGSLQADSPNYVERQADLDIYTALQAREFSYVFSARQMGKSSLLVRVKERLQQDGALCACLDMTRLGSNGLTQVQWYAGIMHSLLSSFGCSQQINFRQWWQADQDLALVQRLNQLLEEVLLLDAEGPPLYIFIDEIDSLLSLEFSTDDFFAWMRSCYNQRSHNPRYCRLTFAIFGVATPSDLIADKRRTPFNLGRAIPLTGFSLTESAPLLLGLEPWLDPPYQVLKSILAWTDGQPFLTQKLCDIAVQTVQRSQTVPLALSAGMAEVWVEDLVRSRVLGNWETQDEPVHLRTIRDHLFWFKNRTARLLGIYQQLLQGETILTDDSREQVDLLLSGLVVRRGDQLVIKNRIYREVFTPAWVALQLHRLRPYATALEAWVASKRQDSTYLLQGRPLQEVEQWARDKSLSDLDYQFLAASQDAERQRIQQVLEAKQESERFFRQLAEALPQIVWIVEPDGSLAYTNQQGSNFSGRSLDEMQGWQRINVLHPDDRATSLAAWEQAFATSEPYEVQVRMQDAEGNYRWFLNRAVPIRDAQGNVVKWFGTSTDLDELKRDEEAKRLKEVEARLVEQEKRLHQEQRAIRLQRWLLGSVSLALVISTGLGLFAAAQKRQSALGEVEALALSSEALFASNKGFDALLQAIRAKEHLQSLYGVNATLRDQVDAALRHVVISIQQFNRLDGHTAAVLAVDYSPDGQQIATAGVDGTVKLWKPDGTLLKTLKGHTTVVRSVKFSPDGTLLATGGDDKTIKLWRRDGTLIKSTPTGGSDIWSIAFSPDSSTFISGGVDGSVQQWSRSGQWLMAFPDNQSSVRVVAFSPDGQTIAAGNADTTISLWNQNGTPYRTLAGHAAIVQAIAFSPDGRTLISGDANGVIKRWQRDGTLLKTVQGHKTGISSLGFSSDGALFASASRDNTVKLWRPEGSLVTTLQGHAAAVWGVAFSPDGRAIASAGADNTTLLWKTESAFQRTIYGNTDQPMQLVFNKTGTAIASSGGDTTIKRWQLDGTPLPTINAHAATTGKMALSPDGTILASVSDDQTLKLWTFDGTLMRVFKDATTALFSVAWNPNGQQILASGANGTIWLWQPDGTLLRTFKGHTAPISDIKFSPDGQLLASASSDKTVRLWQPDGTPIKTLAGHTAAVWRVAFSPDSQMLASSSGDTTIKLWHRDGTLDKTLTGHKAAVWGVAFSLDGNLIATASIDETVKLWKRDGTLLTTLEGHTSGVRALAFHPHQPILASVGDDQTIVLWNLDQILRLKPLDYACTWVKDYLKNRPQSDRKPLCQGT